ncbi:LLM class flavin-dependent oxidoreductase [Micromonospora inositola]|uniref:Flavin-dependent oxidoreductase, luciferase family (Includes alkanesulfonate monooxygenase SsuD and methylene tetrahydromethanopterin reductase) n=1 Tax=Micromonospora inositola TaxID=47865 RepID=A0A1C5K5B0_9ACTN|nr:LLM class flavin-dependent oxidoreductase [Micromonospora inositola]SCG77970.1 Flavin-dependent oxidoreductase, luciferase family (includes alkanesulfonate monooxygenase SsuD and methylene tetrahydromethanopterin reductase) [Micromonospora inositola]
MRFGLLLTTQHHPGEDIQAIMHGHLEMVRHARDGGWDSVWAGQHYLQTGLAGMQPVPLLARFAAEAHGMTLGTCIQLLSLQNPVAVAEETANLDVLSGGRFVYSAGLGYRDVEYQAFGLDRSDGVRRFEENLSVVKQLWSGDPVDVDLPWCRINQVQLTLPPIQRPHPPVWIAANSDAAVRRAARVGDAWLINPHATLPTIARQHELFLHAREEAGLPAPTTTPIVREAICAPDSATAARLAAAHLGEKYKSYTGWGQDKALPRTDRDFEAPYEELARGRFVVGSPAQCLDDLGRIVERVGADHLILRVNWAGMTMADSLRTIDLLTSEVLPHLRTPRD